jgi:mRNA interferase RelE/StbE
MASYTVTFARSARRELEKLPAGLAERILLRIERLANEPRPAGCRKLRGERDLWRLRIGDYRVVYSVDDRRRVVDVSVVRHRHDAYRN